LDFVKFTNSLQFVSVETLNCFVDEMQALDVYTYIRYAVMVAIGQGSRLAHSNNNNHEAAAYLLLIVEWRERSRTKWAEAIRCRPDHLAVVGGALVHACGASNVSLAES